MGGRNIVRLLGEGMIGKEPFEIESDEVAYFLPAVDDTGKFAFGDGTTDADVEIYLGSTSNYVKFNVGDTQMSLGGVDISSNAAIVTTSDINCANLNMTGTLTPSSAGAIAAKVVDVSDNTKTLNTSHIGGYVMARGAGASTFTLPAAGASAVGQQIYIQRAVDADLTVSVATANTLIALHDLAANSVIANTSSEKIGAAAVFTCVNATHWAACPLYGTWTVIA